ncbi:MAG: hypothetical protein AB7O91_11825, partial [Sphingomonas sp.]
MRVARDRLIFLALCALDETVDEARDGPVQRTFALRAMLAFLYALSDGREPGCYGGFWRNVTRAGPQQGCPDIGQRTRSEFARDQLRRIAKSLGFDFDYHMRAPISRARGKPLSDDELKAKAFRDTADEREKQKERGRRAR